MTETKEKPKAVDLSAFDTGVASDKGYKLELVHPITREPLGCFITVTGKDGTAFREHVRRTGNDRLRRQFQQSRKGKDAEAPTIEQIEAEAIDLLVVCTIGFENIEYKGAVLPYSAENARKLYTEQQWIRTQVDEAIADLENFMQA